MSNWTHLLTEQRNRQSDCIDEQSTLDMVRIINTEDASIASAVSNVLKEIATTIDLVVESLESGGRLFYVGAGSSGRLGVLDAAECPPTYSTEPKMVQAIIAGGPNAVFKSVEGAEDNADAGANAMVTHNVTNSDCVIGIAASGITPFVHGALTQARSFNSVTILVTCSPSNRVKTIADIMIAPLVGPEVITGSTRMKAGTATKMILNMISTATMIHLGKTMGNLMVDLQPTNSKLLNRAIRILQIVLDVTSSQAEQALIDAHNNVKVAIVMYKCNVGLEQARILLTQNGGRIKSIIKNT